MKNPLLSVVMPVYNEIATLKEILKRVDGVEIDKEIIIVDDCSKDGTIDILKEIKRKDIRVLYQDRNMGKGAAIRRGIKEAKGQIVIIQDADLEYDPQDYKILIKPILEGKTNVVYGTRFARIGFKDFFNREKIKNPIYFLGNKFLSLMTTLIYLRKITDMETCYKTFRRELIQSIELRANKFDIEPEITSKLLKIGHMIIEVPINFKPRSFEEGKKIHWKDGVAALWVLIRNRFSD